jgi:hypothetical protein
MISLCQDLHRDASARVELLRQQANKSSLGEMFEGNSDRGKDQEDQIRKKNPHGLLSICRQRQQKAPEPLHRMLSTVESQGNQITAHISLEQNV